MVLSFFRYRFDLYADKSILNTLSSLPNTNLARALDVGVLPICGGPKNTIVPVLDIYIEVENRMQKLGKCGEEKRKREKRR